MVLSTAPGPAALRTAASIASTWRAFSAAASWECVARVVTPTSICTLSGFAVTRASPVTRIDDSVGAGVSARAGTEPAAPTSSTATRHGVFPTQVERIGIFYACCVRQFIVWTGGRACARPGRYTTGDGRRRNPCCSRPLRGYLGRGAARGRAALGDRGVHVRRRQGVRCVAALATHGQAIQARRRDRHDPRHRAPHGAPLPRGAARGGAPGAATAGAHRGASRVRGERNRHQAGAPLPRGRRGRGAARGRRAGSGAGTALPAEHGVGPHARLESERGAMRAGHDAQVPERLREALERVLGARIGHVRVIEHSWYARAHGRAVATTRRGRIYLSGSATEFFANPWLMLHEYCHVIRQWEAGTLTLARYAGEWLRHGYWNNRFEVEERAFADSHVADLHTLLARTPTAPPARLS